MPRQRLSGPTAILSALLATLLLAACSPDGSDAHRAAHAGPPSQVMVFNRYVHHFDTLKQLSVTSEQIVVGKISSERRGEWYGIEEEMDQDRILTIDVEETLKGPSATRVVEFRTLGWTRSAGRILRLVEHDNIVANIDDRVIAFLSTPTLDRGKGRPADVMIATNNQSLFVLSNGQVKDSPRRDRLVKQVEAMTEADLRSAVRAAAE